MTLFPTYPQQVFGFPGRAKQQLLGRVAGYPTPAKRLSDAAPEHYTAGREPSFRARGSKFFVCGSGGGVEGCKPFGGSMRRSCQVILGMIVIVVSSPMAING